MTDELLNDLGDYFVRWRIGHSFGLTFQHFVEQYLAGGWSHVPQMIALEGGEQERWAKQRKISSKA